MGNAKFVSLKPYKIHRFRKNPSKKYFELSVEEANHYLYNGLPLPDIEVESKWVKNVKRLIDKDEKFRDIGSYLGCHYITSKGRMINSKTPRFMTCIEETSPKWGVRLMFMINKSQMQLDKLMEKFGWYCDYDEIREFYKQTDYPVRKVDYKPPSQRYKNKS